MKEKAKNLNNTVKIEKEVISLKDILEIKIVNALLKEKLIEQDIFLK